MLFALGLGSKIVGDTTYCDYPAAARTIQKIGDSTPNYERIVALHPDLVVVDTVALPAAESRLRALRVRTVAVAPESFDQVELSLKEIGASTGTFAQARRVIAVMEKRRAQATAIASSDGGRRPKVFVVIQINPLWSAGSRTYIDDLITKGGGINVATNLVKYAPYSKEEVLAATPDVVLVSERDRPGFLADPAMRDLAAVRHHRVYSITDENIIDRPGPRLGDGLVMIAKLLHPKSNERAN